MTYKAMKISKRYVYFSLEERRGQTSGERERVQNFKRKIFYHTTHKPIVNKSHSKI